MDMDRVWFLDPTSSPRRSKPVYGPQSDTGEHPQRRLLLSWRGGGWQVQWPGRQKRGPRQLRPALIHIITPMALGRGLKVGYPRRSGPTGGRWNSSPWNACSPFGGRSWIAIFNIRSGSSAISRRWVLQPYFACGGPKLTKTANAFRTLSVTHLKNDTANYLGLGRSRLAVSVPEASQGLRYFAERWAMPGDILVPPARI